MKKITIILPIHKLDDNYDVMLKNSIQSVEDFHNDVKVSIVCPGSLKDKIKNLSNKLEIDYVINNGSTDFCTQINLGITKCDTEWFSILEVDDQYKSVWLKNMNDYIQENPDVDIFLPIVKDINQEGKFLSFTNESTWAYGFTEKQGYLDNEVLLDFQNYQE